MAKYRIKMNCVPKFKWYNCPSKRMINSKLYLETSIWCDGSYKRFIIRGYNVKIRNCKRSDDKIFIITANFECPKEFFSTYESEVLKYLWDFCNIEIKEIKKPYKRKS